MTSSWELVVMVTGSSDAADRLAASLPDVAFEQTSIPTTEGVAGTHLTVRMDDRAEAEELAHRIGEMAGVTAVYVKPAGELP